VLLLKYLNANHCLRMKLSCLAVAMATVTLAKEVTEEDGRKTHIVQASGVTEDLCFFRNNNDQWCFAATPPMMKVGWEFKQAYTKTPSTILPVLSYYQV